MSTTAVTLIAGFWIVALGSAWATVRWGSWRLLAVGVIGVVSGAGLGVWLYSKRPVPEHVACALPSARGELGSICGFVNPEDLEHIPSLGVVLVSEEGFGGRLLSLRPDDLEAGPRVLWPPAPERLARMAERGGDLGDRDCPFPADPSALWPHGLSALEPREPGEPVRIAFVSHTLVNGIITDRRQRR